MIDETDKKEAKFEDIDYKNYMEFKSKLEEAKNETQRARKEIQILKNQIFAIMGILLAAFAFFDLDVSSAEGFFESFELSKHMSFLNPIVMEFLGIFLFVIFQISLFYTFYIFVLEPVIFGKDDSKFRDRVKSWSFMIIVVISIFLSGVGFAMAVYDNYNIHAVQSNVKVIKENNFK